MCWTVIDKEMLEIGLLNDHHVDVVNRCELEVVKTLLGLTLDPAVQLLVVEKIALYRITWSTSKLHKIKIHDQIS
jgi:hypothetical protein